MKIRIKNDTFDISDRLHEIDDGYFILYDTKKKAYEVHNKNQMKNTYALTIPYENLDSRTVDLVRRTRIENKEKLLREIDNINEKVKEQMIKDAIVQMEKDL